MKKLHIAIITGLGLVCMVISVLVLIWYLTVFLDEPGVNHPLSIADYWTTGHTEIDPQSLLSSLEQGDLDIFQLEAGLPEEPSNPPIVVEWTQADYFKITEAIQQVVWEESMDDWNLYRMDYMAPCKDEPMGLFYAELYYFQEVQVNGKSLYSYREILIDPRYEYIAWGGDTLYEKREARRKSIDLNEVAIPAEKAMIEAESRGGREFRLSTRNQCSISIKMNPSSYQRFDWKVYYSAGSVVLPEPQEFWIPSK
jgi:hypothetical protein